MAQGERAQRSITARCRRSRRSYPQAKQQVLEAAMAAVWLASLLLLAGLVAEGKRERASTRRREGRESRRVTLADWYGCGAESYEQRARMQ